MQPQTHKHIDDICSLLSKKAEAKGYLTVVGLSNEWRNSLLDAAVSGSLKAYNPSTQMLYIYNPKTHKTSPWFRLSELNTWLADGNSNLSFDNNWNLITNTGLFSQTESVEISQKLSDQLTQEGKKITKHVLKTKPVYEMDIPVRKALELTPEPKTTERVWGMLRDMADSKEGFEPLRKFVPKAGNDLAHVLYEDKHGVMKKYTYKMLTDKLYRIASENL